MRCDCEDEGRDAYRYSRYSYETEHRLSESRFGGDECDREFADGYRSEQRRDEERREEYEAEEQAIARAQRERMQQEQYEMSQAEAEYYREMEMRDYERGRE